MLNKCVLIDRLALDPELRYTNEGRIIAVTGRLQIRKNTNERDRSDINPDVVAKEIKFLDKINSLVDPELQRKAKAESEQEFNNKKPNIVLDDIDENMEGKIQPPF